MSKLGTNEAMRVWFMTQRRLEPVECGKEEAGELELAGLYEAKTLEDVVALGRDVEGGVGGGDDNVADDIEVKRASGIVSSILGLRRREAEDEKGDDSGGMAEE
ncbi:hypothetical protein NL676_004048 [Syzygium grande]|nr:hypothetical protein NL676_004048 [Syzygium grande]